MNYLQNLATWASQTVNVWRGGHPDLSVSASLHIAAGLGSERAARWERRVDALFFWHDRHCYRSFMSDVRHARYVLDVAVLLDQRSAP